MPDHQPERHRSPSGGVFLAVAVIGVGLTLRGPITAVSPVLTDIQRDLGISSAAAGLLTSLPVLCFAVVSPVVAALTRRIGVDTAVAVSLVILMVGVALRPWAGFGVMLAGTLLIGAAIAVGNVLLPVVVRRDFPHRPGPVLSASTTSLIVSAALPAALTAPLALLMGWRGALAVWAVMTVAAIGLWWAATKHARHPQSAQPAAVHVATSVWRSVSAWELGLFFGMQALLFYATTAWLPTILRVHSGFDATTAGTAMSTFQLLGIAGAVAVPVIATRGRTRRMTAALLAVLWIALFAGLLLAPAIWPLWCLLGGLTQGGSLALGISLIAIRSTSTAAANNVSAMVQTVGYSLSALGPVAIGVISGASDGWVLPVQVLIGASVACGVLGIRAAASRPIA